MIRPPVFVYEPSNLRIFESVDDAERYLEPIDVLSGGHEAYDSAGRLLELKVSARERRLLGVFRGQVDYVCVRPAKEESLHKERLREILTEYLEEVVPGAVERVRSATFDELVAMARPLALTK